MIYSLASGGGGERPTITVAAIASLFSTGEYNHELAGAGSAYVKPLIPTDSCRQPTSSAIPSTPITITGR